MGKSTVELRGAQTAAALKAAAIKRDADDEDEMAREASLLKKLKRGKITQKQFDKLMGEASDDDEDDED